MQDEALKFKFCGVPSNFESEDQTMFLYLNQNYG